MSGWRLELFLSSWIGWKLQRHRPRAELPEYWIKNCCTALLLVGRTLYRKITWSFLIDFLSKSVSFHWIMLEITVFHQFQNVHILPQFCILKIRDILYKWWHLTIGQMVVMIELSFACTWVNLVKAVYIVVTSIALLVLHELSSSAI